MDLKRTDSPLDFNLWLATIPGIPADWGAVRNAGDIAARRTGLHASHLRRHRGLPQDR